MGFLGLGIAGKPLFMRVVKVQNMLAEQNIEREGERESGRHTDTVGLGKLTALVC